MATSRPFWSIALVLALPVLAGCLGPNVPAGPEGFHVILVETGYDASERVDARQRPQDKAVDLPAGHPASHLGLRVNIDAGPGYDRQTWEYDEPCENGEAFHGPYADCSGFDRQDAYVLPSPEDADDHARIKYPLNGEGTVVFHIPEPLEVTVFISDDYTEELRGQAEDPDRCDEWPKAGSGWVEDRGEADRSERSDGPADGTFTVTGDVRLDARWFGVCPDEASS